MNGSTPPVDSWVMTQKMVELALELQYLYMDVLFLQALLEGFVGNDEGRRLEEERDVQDVIAVCRGGVV